MPEVDLREVFSSWAAPFGQLPPPDISSIRRRVRRRTLRRVSGGAVAIAAACGLTAVALASVSGAGHSSPPVTKTTERPHHEAGQPPESAAPYYMTVSYLTGTATVRRTATGATITTVRRPRGARFTGITGAEDDATFVLAAQTKSGNAFYRLRLDGKGRPGRLVLIPAPALPGGFGSCPTELLGLAISVDARLLAISLGSNCPNGRAGPAEILTVQLGSGRTEATFHPGHGYPMSLSWTASRSLAYSWTSTRTGVFIIPDATNPGSSPRMLLSGSASVRGFSGADDPLITPDGSAVIVTVARGSSTFAIAEFFMRGSAPRLLTPPVHSPSQFCGALWTDTSGRKLLTACGDNSEYQIQGRRLTKLQQPWHLPIYNTPGTRLIAW